MTKSMKSADLVGQLRETVRAEVARRFKQGIHIRRIAHDLQRQAGTIRRLLLEADVRSTGPAVLSREAREVASLIRGRRRLGFSIYQIAWDSGLSEAAVKKFLAMPSR